MKVVFRVLYLVGGILLLLYTHTLHTIGCTASHFIGMYNLWYYICGIRVCCILSLPFFFSSLRNLVGVYCLISMFPLAYPGFLLRPSLNFLSQLAVFVYFPPFSIFLLFWLLTFFGWAIKAFGWFWTAGRSVDIAFSVSLPCLFLNFYIKQTVRFYI